MKTEERKTARELLSCIGDTDNVLFLSSVKVGEFSAVVFFFFLVCITCICEAKIGLAKCYEHAKNMYLVSSMSRCPIFL